jgi:hypothetical protein
MICSIYECKYAMLKYMSVNMQDFSFEISLQISYN